MLGNLRSRRRPPYGTYICAAVSSILLMLSVSFLYSSLSHSHPNFHTNLFHRNSVPSHDSSNYDSPLSDSVYDNISGTEEKIDALDVIEEQQEHEDLRNVELEEEDEPFEQIKVSGHFFDHVSGVIRRAYDKSSIEAWKDTQTGFFMGVGVEDRSKAAFGSDDVPVDDLVRRKAIQVLGIEDALLLKVGKRVSPLREGWGYWFDKKADFLRKDKMLKSNFKGLNPLHNPILQDPDGVGVTGLTKGDRIFQKSLIDDFKKVPFPYLGSKDNRKSPKLQGNEAKAKECESKTGGKLFPVDDSDVGKYVLPLNRRKRSITSVTVIPKTKTKKIRVLWLKEDATTELICLSLSNKSIVVYINTMEKEIYIYGTNYKSGDFFEKLKKLTKYFKNIYLYVLIDYTHHFLSEIN